jgi:hypothetical protein
MMNTFMDRVNAIVQNNQASMDQDVSYPDAGIGALENVANNVPRQADLMNQPHMLAYINPQEEQMLRDMGGAGIPGPDGIPVYGWWSDTVSAVKNAFSGGGSSAPTTSVRPKARPKNLVTNYATTAVPDTNKNKVSAYVPPVVQPVVAKPVVTPTIKTTPQPIKDSINVVPTANSTKEDLANLLTPGDGASYVSGQLIDDATGAPIRAGGMTSTGNKIYGTANTSDNDIKNYLGYGSKPVLNTSRETLANIITPNDRAAYINGQLVNTLTGASLEGGGYTYDAEGENPDYVYGVSDDFSNNAAVDTTNMTTAQANAAVANQQMRRDIPPSQLAYFGSFLGGLAVPMVGGFFATKLLDKSIAERQAIVDQETAALEAGATPRYNAAGEYVGHYTYDDEMADTFGSGNIYTEDFKGASTVNYGLGQSNKVFGEGSYTTSMDNQGSDSGNILNADVTDNADNMYIPTTNSQAAANSIYNRYYKGGSGIGLPPWLRKYASGVNINQLLEKTTIEGVVYYKTPEGNYIAEAELVGAKMGAVETPETETDE